jgi:predicted nucleotidyltransferase
MLFDETVKWKVLGKFFGEPEREYYVKELAKELRISPGSVSLICRELRAEGLLGSHEKGRALFYSLNNNPLVLRLKSAWFVNRLMKHRSCWEHEEIQSVALYGSRASGEFISKSDIDVLVVSNAAREALEKSFEGLKKQFGERLSLTVFSLAQWRKLARQKDRFYIEVLANHVLLSGPSLVVG